MRRVGQDAFARPGACLLARRSAFDPHPAVARAGQVAWRYAEVLAASDRHRARWRSGGPRRQNRFRLLGGLLNASRASARYEACEAESSEA